jgi:hypothetical protein
MAIYRGLNVAKALNDVDDSSAALINLGLNKLDLDLVSGLTASENDVNIREFHTVAGLVVDQKKTLYSLGRSSEAMAGELNSLADIKQPLGYNYRLNSQLQAGAIKYGYFDFATNTQKQADISTSRVSSWSTIGNTISYGGEVKVVGPTFSFLTLGTTVAPLAKSFRSEVPTHAIKLKVDGVEQDFLAMKGIPLVFDTFFRNADLTAGVNAISDGSGVIPITWRITNEDDGQSYNSGDGSGGSTSVGTGSELSPVTFPFRDSTSKARKLEFFYNPANVVRLSLNGLNLSTWTNVSLPALKRLDISSNDFYQLPSFRSDASAKTSLTAEGLAPVLTHMTINNNNMSRATNASGVQITANAQLNTLPTTLQSLEMNGVFSDSTTIDLLDYTSLTNFYMHSYYDSYAQRSMTGGTVMPKVATSIQSYQIYNQPFSQMCNGLINSTNLTYLWFPWCGTSQKEGGGDITIASPVIQYFLSYGNGHNVVNMSAKTSLVNYTQQYSSPSGSTTFVSKFTGCTALVDLNFYGSGVTGSIQAGLQNLESLRTFEGRYSGISGELRDTSFQGTNKLVTLLLAASSHTGTDFFGSSPTNSSQGGTVFHNTLDLQNLYAYSNKNIRGQMPNMSKSVKLRVVYLHNTGLSGPLPAFSGCDSLYYIEMNYTRDGDDQGFTGTIPTYSLPGLNYLFLTFNRLTGQCPAFQCPFLYQLSIDSNELVGSIPNLSGCSRLQRIIMNNNSMTGYVEGNLRSNIYASVIDISNNKLTAAVGPTLISDLLKNWGSNPRSGVTVNLLGNSVSGVGLTESNTRNDGTDPTSETSTASKLDTLRAKGWTILMD